MNSFGQDVRYAFRVLLGKPGFSLTVILTLALGIGANTAVFSFVNSFFMRPLPADEPDELVRVYQFSDGGRRFSTFSYPNYVDLRDRGTGLEGLAAHQYANAGVRMGGNIDEVQGELVTGNYFELLGISAARGRNIGPDDDIRPGGHPVVVISDGLWRRNFGASEDVVGDQLVINGHTFTIIGVAPDSFRGSYPAMQADFWAPLAMYEQVRPRGIELTNRGWGWLDATGRLAEDVPIEEAQSEIAVLSAQLAAEYPMNDGTGFEIIRATHLPERMGGTISTVSGFFMIVVGLLLLATCANVANMIMVRATLRNRETAVRQALGAGRWRLVRQWLTESFVVAGLGGIVGVALSLWIADGLAAQFPAELGISPALGLDVRVLLFAGAASLMTGALFGLIPAVRAARSDLRTALTGGSGNRSRRSALRAGFVITQVVVSAVILVGAGLLLRSLSEARRFDPGFETENLVIAGIDLRRNGYSMDQTMAFFQDLLDRLEAAPEVASVTVAGSVPLGGGRDMRQYRIEGQEPPEGQFGFRIDFNAVGPGYFETVGIPILRGRGIDWRDLESGSSVAVINDTMARRFWSVRDPIGERLDLGNDVTVEIVGVVATTNYVALAEEPLPFVFHAIGPNFFLGSALHLRSAGAGPRAVVSTLRDTVAALDPNLAISGGMTFDQVRMQTLVANRAMAVVSAAFGLLALMLAAVGIYGVLSHAVVERTREIGVRMALGAHRASILKMVVFQAIFYTGIGLIVGLGVALAGAQSISSLLFGIQASDPVTFGSIAVLLLAVSAAATVLPAYRALRVDPMVSLRYD